MKAYVIAALFLTGCLGSTSPPNASENTDGYSVNPQVESPPNSLSVPAIDNCVRIYATVDAGLYTLNEKHEGTPLGCFSTCPGGDRCIYLYTGVWPEPGSDCSVYECAERPETLPLPTEHSPGCRWVVWQTPATNGEGWVCGNGPN